MVWDLRTYVRVRTPEYRNTFGPVSQVMWIPSRSGTPTLCSGTGLGYLCIWVQSTDKVSGPLKVMTTSLTWVGSVRGHDHQEVGRR